jgi:hypothetical protein
VRPDDEGQYGVWDGAVNELCGWALAYEPETAGSRWGWAAGNDWPRNPARPAA